VITEEVMMITRRKALPLLLAVGAAQPLASKSFAETYPSRPIQLYVGFPPGGATDIMARMAAHKLSESLGQPVVVRNQPGASTLLATGAVGSAAPDGYTLLLIPISTAVYSGLSEKVPYNLERDFVPISLVARGPFLLIVNPAVPVHNLKGLLELARSQPGKLNGASVGVGSAHHLALELFKAMAKVDIVHVPYRGAAPADVAVAAGEVQMSISSAPGAMALLDSGKIRVLAVTSDKRMPQLPSVPTVSEAGVPGYEYTAWYGVSAPARVPKQIVDQLNAAIGKAVQAPDMEETLFKQGFEPESSTPEEFAAIIHREIERTIELKRLAGLNID
jgi:tripartite-type tricarboxylate transporter receptor subunit TctC